MVPMDEGDRIYGFRARRSTVIGPVGEDDAKAMVGRRQRSIEGDWAGDERK